MPTSGGYFGVDNDLMKSGCILSSPLGNCSRIVADAKTSRIRGAAGYQSDSSNYGRTARINLELIIVVGNSSNNEYICMNIPI